MKLAEIIKNVTVNEIIGDAEREIMDIQIDSRLSKPGSLFVAIKGTQTDGHAYIQKAMEHALSYANNSPKKSDRT